MKANDFDKPTLLSIPSDLLREILLICLENKIPFAIQQYHSHSDSFLFSIQADSRQRSHKMPMENIFSLLEDYGHYRYDRPNEPFDLNG